jgi:polyhydroxybutyrate depolymerase
MNQIARFLVATSLVATTLVARAQTTSSFVFDGTTRSFIVYTPPSYVPGSSLPLVFVLHGFTQNAQTIMDVSSFNSVADTGNFIVVYPNGIGNAWNTNSGMTGGSTANDIGFIAALTDTMFSRYNIDTTRVYSCGFSAGGYMSHRLACESSRCYAAIASVAGTMSSGAYTACNPIRPVPVLQIHGTSDGVVSYNGGTGGVSVDDVIAKWVAADVCPTVPVVTALPNTNLFDNSTVESNSYYPCTSNYEVKLLKVIGGGHQWPGTNAILGGLGTINRDIHASGEIWKFFRGYTCNTVSTGVAGSFAEADFSLERYTSDLFLVSAPAGQVIRYFLRDLNGRDIFSGQSENGGTIDISTVSHGCYILTVTSERSARSYRLVR